MRKAVALVGSVLLAFSLCSCEEKISEGTIYEKEFEPAYTNTWIQPVYTGKYFICIPHSEYNPDSWYFSIYQGDGDERETARWQVSESQYNSYEVGDYFVAEWEARE